MNEDLRILNEQKSRAPFQNRKYKTAAKTIDYAKRDIRLVKDISTGFVYNATLFTHALHNPIAAGNEIAIWGVASERVTVALLNSRAGRPVQAVIDINSFQARAASSQ